MIDGGQRFKTQMKIFIMRTLSGLRILKIFNTLTRGSVSIFMLHRLRNDAVGIQGHSVSSIIRALEYLKRKKYNVVSLEEAFQRLQGSGPPLMNAVAFTMDDGYSDQADDAAALFQKYDCPVTIFLITGFLDGILWPWDARAEYIFNTTKRRKFTLTHSTCVSQYHCDDKNERNKSLRIFLDYAKQSPQDQMDGLIHMLSNEANVVVPETPPLQYSPLSWDQARKLEKNGGVRFGAHSVSHRILSGLPADIAEFEIHESWNRLVVELHDPLRVFCYPIGRATDYGQREIDVLKKLKFQGAVSAQAGYAKFDSQKCAEDEKYIVPRFPFPDLHEDFLQYSSGIERIKELIRSSDLRKSKSSPVCK